MHLHISSHLSQYTKGVTTIEVQGGTLDAALKDLDRQYPGIRFRFIDEQDRVREHFNVFVNREKCHDLGRTLTPQCEVHVLAALSGG
jgi:molybdopterin converting factor small subunit